MSTPLQCRSRRSAFPLNTPSAYLLMGSGKGWRWGVGELFSVCRHAVCGWSIRGCCGADLCSHWTLQRCNVLLVPVTSHFRQGAAALDGMSCMWVACSAAAHPFHSDNYKSHTPLPRTCALAAWRRPLTWPPAAPALPTPCLKSKRGLSWGACPDLHADTALHLGEPMVLLMLAPT